MLTGVLFGLAALLRGILPLRKTAATYVLEGLPPVDVPVAEAADALDHEDHEASAEAAMLAAIAVAFIDAEEAEA